MQTDYVEIPLSAGYVAKVSPEDAERVSQFNWVVKRKRRGGAVYAHRSVRRPDGRMTTVTMHRFIMDVRPGVTVDHVNRDGLDNRRCNLRVTNESGNARNRKKGRGSSPYRGVWKYPRGKWASAYTYRGEQLSLGVFDTPEEAARAYDAAVISAGDVFTPLNFPDATSAEPTGVFVRQARKQRNNSESRFLGVVRAQKKWMAKMGSPHGERSFGSYECQELAAVARDLAAVGWLGVEGCLVNFPSLANLYAHSAASAPPEWELLPAWVKSEVERLRVNGSLEEVIPENTIADQKTIIGSGDG